MAALYKLSPEVAGQLGSNTIIAPPRDPRCLFPDIKRLEYEFNAWLGDDIVESPPCYVVSARLAEGLSKSGLSGLKLDKVQISKSGLFREMKPRFKLPDFRWLIPQGCARLNPDRAATIEWTGDDLCLSQRADLVVTKKALTVFQQFKFEHCEIQELADQITNNRSS